MLAVFALCFAFQASAIDWVDITLGESYPVAAFGKFYGKYTASESKTLYEESLANARVYTEEYVDENSSASALLANRNWTGSYYPYSFKLSVEAGKTYYFVMDSFQFDPWNFKLYAPSEFDIKKIEPAEGSSISHLGVGDGRLYITFTEVPEVQYVRIGKSDGFKTDNTGSIICPYAFNANTMGVDIQEALTNLYTKGLNQGDEITLALRVKKPNGEYWEGNGNGIHYIKFIAAGKPVSLINEKVPGKILSYMAPDNENGKLVLTFDGDIDPATSANQIFFEYGNKEAEEMTEYGEFPIPFTVDGSVLTLDFTGVSRRRTDLLPYSTTPYSTIDVRIQNIKDAKGMYVNSAGLGTVGSFSYRLNYEELPVVNITQEIIPASGTSLKNVESINWWFNNADALSFDGVRFDYKNAEGNDASVVVPMSEISNASLSPAEKDLTIKVPADVKAGRNVLVTLNNLSSNDGIDHSAELSARYDAFTITSITPAANSNLEMLTQGQVINVKSNMDATNPNMYLTYELIDNNPSDPAEAILLNSYMQREDNGSHSCEMFFDLPLYLGHTYTFRVNYFENEEASHGVGGYEATPQGYDEVKWNGTTQPFSFSTYKFESVSPVSGTELTSATQNKFTLVFDGMVNLPADECYILMGMGMHQNFESLTPVDPTEGYSNTWEAVVSESYLSGVTDYLSLSFRAYDMDGKLVEGNSGNEEGSYFYFNYPVTFNTPEFTCVPADGAEVESLSKFVLSYETGIFPSWITPEKIQLVSKTEVVAVFNDEDFEYEDDTDSTGALYTKSITLTLPIPVTTEGVYTLMVPSQYFSLGSEQLAQYSKAQNFMFTVKNQGGGNEEPSESVITFTPPYTENQTHLDSIELVWDEEEEIGLGSGKATLTLPDASVITLPDADLDFFVYNKAIQSLGDDYSAEGQYVVTFPAGYFTLGTFGDRDEKEIKVTYNIVSTSAIDEILNSADGLYNVYNMNGVSILLNVTIDEVKTLPAGMYIINGEKFILR